MSVCGVGFGKESSYGEDVALTKWVPAKNFKWTSSKGTVTTNTMASLGPKYAVNGLFGVTGSFEMLARTEDIGQILYSIFGGLTSTDITSAYSHAHVPAATVTTYTCGVAVDSGGGNTNETFPGWFATSVNLKGRAGEPITMTVNFIAQTHHVDSRGSPTFSTDPALVLVDSNDYFKLDTVEDTYVTAFDITITREYPSLEDETPISNIVRQHATPGIIKMEGTVNRLYKDLTALKNFLGSASATEPDPDGVVNTRALDILSKSTVIARGSNYHQLQIEADNLIFDTRDAEVNEQNLQIEDLKFVTQDDGSSDWIEVTHVNATESY